MPAPSSADRRYLERHGNKWRVVVPVPRDLQDTVGKRKLKVSLETDSLAEANRLKWPIVGGLKDRLARLRSPEAAEADALSLAALRRQLADAWREDQLEAIDTVILERAEAIAGPPIGVRIVGDQEEPQYDPKRLAAALEFAGVAQGRRTPITAHRDAWLKQLDVKPRTRADDERAFKWFREWCEQQGVPAFLETLDGRHAVAFTDHLKDRGGRSVVTLNKYITRLSLYWKWLKGRHVVSGNIWEGRSYTEPFRTAEELERPFTDDEVFDLLSGPATPQMHDLMRVAALTGARLEAIASLTVGRCRGGVFTFLPQKRESSARDCPIHPDLVEIVRRRTEGKADHDLFPEWPPVRKAESVRERSFKASNHFTDYRRAVGVDDRREGNRRSRINFHSFRRWFITKAEQAGQPESTIQTVVGHKRASIAFGEYSGGPSMEQLTECVNAVQLPKQRQKPKPKGSS